MVPYPQTFPESLFRKEDIPVYIVEVAVDILNTNVDGSNGLLSNIEIQPLTKY